MQRANNLLVSYRLSCCFIQSFSEVTFTILDRSIPADFHDATDEFLMVGDVNLFLHEWLDEGVGELEVMIAHEPSKRKGLAQEALRVSLSNIDEFNGAFIVCLADFINVFFVTLVNDEICSISLQCSFIYGENQCIK